jgi:hypothetical protein
LVGFGQQKCDGVDVGVGDAVEHTATVKTGPEPAF